MQKFQRFNVAIGAILAVAILFFGFRLHLPEGWARGGVVMAAAVVFFLLAFAWKPKPPTTLNSFALPLLLIAGVNSWQLGAGLVLLALLAAAGKAVADAQAHGSPRLLAWRPRWAGPEAWRLKYKGGEPSAGPAFPLATTLLVFLTDLWHCANFFTWLAADAAVLLLAWAGAWRWWAVAYVVARRVAFQPLYSWLRRPL